ncbi:hypothetical protein [Tropicibacter oceani]|uniref:Uncharacterized protein n=1 Tax=Tropicibacter oceani TaxID=3058420 RepID=A0ABY8QIS6_9RHOB|nr:hypothetical protein [Tropicibacter oceani]WGW04534.1 hypothetical protein QF118_02995 [Tropicibacter oceani]
MSDEPVYTRKIIAKDELSTLVQDRVTVHTLEDLRRVSAAFDNGDFWQQLERMADDCDKILKECGYPPASDQVGFNSEGEWRYFSLDEWKKDNAGWTMTNGAHFVQTQTADFSNEWYAARIGHHIRLVLMSKDKENDPKGHIYSMIFEISRLRTEWEWRATRKEQIVSTIQRNRHLSELREKQNEAAKATVESRRALVESMLGETKLTGGALDKWIKVQLHKRHDIDVSPRTIRGDRRTLR